MHPWESFQGRVAKSDRWTPAHVGRPHGQGLEEVGRGKKNATQTQGSPSSLLLVCHDESCHAPSAVKRDWRLRNHEPKINLASHKLSGEVGKLATREHFPLWGYYFLYVWLLRIRLRWPTQNKFNAIFGVLFFKPYRSFAYSYGFWFCFYGICLCVNVCASSSLCFWYFFLWFLSFSVCLCCSILVLVCFR